MWKTQNRLGGYVVIANWWRNDLKCLFDRRIQAKSVSLRVSSDKCFWRFAATSTITVRNTVRFLAILSIIESLLIPFGNEVSSNDFVYESDRALSDGNLPTKLKPIHENCVWTRPNYISKANRIGLLLRINLVVILISKLFTWKKVPLNLVFGQKVFRCFLNLGFEEFFA